MLNGGTLEGTLLMRLRAILVACLPMMAFAAPVGAQDVVAQDASRSARQHGVTRDQFIQRAERAAARRFDRIDANHDGVIDRAEMATWRASRHAGQAGADEAGAAPDGPQPPPSRQ